MLQKILYWVPRDYLEIVVSLGRQYRYIVVF